MEANCPIQVTPLGRLRATRSIWLAAVALAGRVATSRRLSLAAARSAGSHCSSRRRRKSTLANAARREQLRATSASTALTCDKRAPQIIATGVKFYANSAARALAGRLTGRLAGRPAAPASDKTAAACATQATWRLKRPMGLIIQVTSYPMQAHCVPFAPDTRTRLAKAAPVSPEHSCGAGN